MIIVDVWISTTIGNVLIDKVVYDIVADMVDVFIKSILVSS